MNTPYQNAKLADAYTATDNDGRTLLIGRFDGQASDGHKTDYLARPCTWVVWVRGGQIISAHRYSGGHRTTALREWREIAKMPNVDAFDWDRWAAAGITRDMPYKHWWAPARRLTQEVA